MSHCWHYTQEQHPTSPTIFIMACCKCCSIKKVHCMEITESSEGEHGPYWPKNAPEGNWWKLVPKVMPKKCEEDIKPKSNRDIVERLKDDPSDSDIDEAAIEISYLREQIRLLEIKLKEHRKSLSELTQAKLKSRTDYLQLAGAFSEVAIALEESNGHLYKIVGSVGQELDDAIDQTRNWLFNNLKKDCREEDWTKDWADDDC